MKKVHLLLEIPDEVFDDAVMQALKGKVREIVDSQFDEKLCGIVTDTIAGRIKDFVNRSTSYGLPDTVRRRAEEIIANMVVTEKFDKDVRSAVWNFSQEYVNRVRAEAKGILDGTKEDVAKTIYDIVMECITKYFADKFGNGGKNG